MNYESGDFLHLSDIADSLAALKDFFLEEESACTLFAKLLKCVAEEMNKGKLERLK